MNWSVCNIAVPFQNRPELKRNRRVPARRIPFLYVDKKTKENDFHVSNHFGGAMKENREKTNIRATWQKPFAVSPSSA
jgi:hypothetical protein